MQTWVQAFIILAAVAIIMQMGILLALFLEVRSLGRNLARTIAELQNRLEPILFRVNVILEDSQFRISSIMADTAEVTRLARGQALKFDRLVTEAADRLQQQIARVDQMLSGVMAVVEEGGSLIRRGLWSRVNQASAIVKGFRVGLDVFRGRSPRSSSEDVEMGATVGVSQDEELFI